MPNAFDRLALKVTLVPAAVLAVGAVAIGFVGYRLLQGDARRQCQDQARMVAQSLESVRRAGEDAGQGAGFHALRDSLKRYAAASPDLPVSFRYVALSPASTADKPTLYESGLITAFQADRSMKQIQAQGTDSGGRNAAIYAVPVVASSESCKGCHAAAAAKAGGRHATAGFGWKRGEVVGAAVAYVPSDAASARAAAIFWRVAKPAAAIALLALLVGLLLIHTGISAPLARMLETSRAIRAGQWRARFSVKGAAEMEDLGLSLQETTGWLRDQVAHEEKLRAMFQQFVPAPVAARALGKESDRVTMGAKQPVTVLVLNIRNFALLMEHLPADDTVTTLNEFFTEVNRVIVANGGIVSKYLGDSVLTFFGMPIKSDEHALQAIRAAMAIPQALQDLYVRLDEKFGWELGVGIGISSGEPIVGHFGSSDHMEYTVLGDVVKQAHALEKATKGVPEEDSILIGETTYRQVMSDVHVFDLGERPGQDGKLIRAFAVQGLRSEARAALAA